MTSPLRSLLLTFVILHSSFDILHAAPPPELTVLRQQYDKILAERVTAPFDAGLAELNTKYTAGLDRFIGEAKTAGELKTVLALEVEKKRLADKLPLPAEDDDSTPESLKKLRAIYREQFKKLEEARTANHAALLPAYTAKLAALEVTLTKADRVAEAAEVLTYREGLAQSGPLSPLSGAPPAPGAPQTTLPVAAASTNAPKVKGDDRKAAEWVLSVGGTVEIWGYPGRISGVADLPKGKFALRGVFLDNNNGGIKQPLMDADLHVLGGLERLERVNLSKLEITPAAFAVFQTCPELSEIQLQYNRLGDALWPHLAGLKKLKKIAQGFDSLPVQGLGISQLNRETMDDLFLGNAPIVDDALTEIAQLTQLTKLDLEASKITDAGMPSLTPLKKLIHLSVRGTDVTATGLASLKSAPIISLAYGRSMVDFIEQLPHLSALFPKLERLGLPREVNPTVDDWQKVAQIMPDLKKVDIVSHKFTDSACSGLDLLPELEELRFTYSPITDAGITSLANIKKLDWLSVKEAKITNAALETLAGMKKLKTLTLPTPGNGLTAEGIAKFKKQRPDVKLN